MSDERRRSDRDDDAGGLRQRIGDLLPNVIRRTVNTGVESARRTEDVIRNAVSDFTLPREVVNYIVDVADNTRRDIVRVAAREVREFLESANLNEEVARILTRLSLEIRTEIRFVPNDQALRPSVSSQVRVKDGDEVRSEQSHSSEEPKKEGSLIAEGLDELFRGIATEILDNVLWKKRAEPPAEAAEPSPAPVVPTPKTSARTRRAEAAPSTPSRKRKPRTPRT